MYEAFLDRLYFSISKISFADSNRGFHVIATARDFSVLTDLAAAGMSTVQLDVTDPTSIQNCHKSVSDLTSGHLDILVNNA